MCHQTAMGLQIEQMYQQGMPKKIGKTVQKTLMKKMNTNKLNNNNDNNKSDLNNCKKCNNNNLNNNLNENDFCTCLNNNDKNMKNDLLATFTQWTKIICIKLNDSFEKIQKTNYFKILTKTTQPAHVIAIGILSFVLFAIWPNLIENNDISSSTTNKKSGLALVAYLGAFATHFGAQIWMTFVSGLSLYFALPRHTFGLCQKILFPKYFALNSMLSICTLIMYIKVIGGHWVFSTYIQIAALTICAVIEVTVRLYLAPPLLRLMSEKHRFEVGIGSGQEIGQLNQGDLIKCPHYQKIHKSFRRIHMTVAIGNMTVMVCTFIHLNYLASKISVS